ncbi:DUF2513 domain-containing protein [Lactococcus lactis]|uniref:DUF2513 domain-containing protein n=1 Tax=Lactococcus lactis TaxID=1358 RepID=UPI001C1F7469|nr:DUF2513 domain-containing protein [Lactococcus lactis]MBU7532832.1 DUF2513 domain-containing protein [Lactococcus lactis]
MKLNHDCVREVILDIEKNQSMGNFYGSENVGEHLSQYTDEDIIYSIDQLDQAGFIEVSSNYSMELIGSYMIKGITWEGHQFLDNVRDNKIWSLTKKSASKVASVSLPVMAQLAIVNIKNTLGL